MTAAEKRAARIRKDPRRWKRNGIREANRELADMALEAYVLKVSYGTLTCMNSAQQKKRKAQLREEEKHV